VKGDDNGTKGLKGDDHSAKEVKGDDNGTKGLKGDDHIEKKNDH
jgi:hypothetical protein